MNTGVIFSWDDLLVNTAPAHARSWSIIAKERNLPLPKNLLNACFGRRNEFIISNIFKWSDNPQKVEELSKCKDALFRKILIEDGLEICSGARSLLQALKSEQIPSVIAAYQPRENIDTALDILDLKNNFQTIITDEGAKNAKSGLEILTLAAKAINREPKECVVIENSFSGIEVALIGGFKVIGIASVNPIELLQRAGAHFTASSIIEINIGTIRAVQML